MPLQTVAPDAGTFGGEPGTRWYNDTSKVKYQLYVNFENSCGACIQWAGRIGTWFNVPFHYNCRCRNIPIPPKAQAKPFIDFQKAIRELDENQQRLVIGKANWQLVEKGVVEWKDVVTRTRVRSLADVVDLKNLDVRDMTKAGVNPKTAETAFAMARSPAVNAANATRDAAIERLKQLGMTGDQIANAVAKRLTERVGGIRMRDPEQDLSSFIKAAPWPRTGDRPIPRFKPGEGGTTPVPAPGRGPKPFPIPSKIVAASSIALVSKLIASSFGEMPSVGTLISKGEAIPPRAVGAMTARERKRIEAYLNVRLEREDEDE
jgi:hypothetical protein